MLRLSRLEIPLKLDRIANTPVKASRGGEMSQPVEPPQIESISIEER